MVGNWWVKLQLLIKFLYRLSGWTWNVSFSVNIRFIFWVNYLTKNKLQKLGLNWSNIVFFQVS